MQESLQRVVRTLCLDCFPRTPRTVYPHCRQGLSRATQPTDPTYIPAASKVYVENIDGLPGFENNLVAAFQKKQVNLLVVSDRSLADFEINGFAQSQPAGWAKIIFGKGLPESEASIQLVNIRTGVIAYAVASYRVNSLNGNKSTAEHLAKNLRQKMERDDKRLRNRRPMQVIRLSIHFLGLLAAFASAFLFALSALLALETKPKTNMLGAWRSSGFIQSARRMNGYARQECNKIRSQERPLARKSPRFLYRRARLAASSKPSGMRHARPPAQSQLHTSQGA